MIHHKLLIVTQELPNPSYFETQITVGLVGLARPVSIDGPRLEFPSGLSRVHASDEGREEGWVVVVD